MDPRKVYAVLSVDAGRAVVVAACVVAAVGVVVVAEAFEEDSVSALAEVVAGGAVAAFADCRSLVYHKRRCK